MSVLKVVIVLVLVLVAFAIGRFLFSTLESDNKLPSVEHCESVALDATLCAVDQDGRTLGCATIVSIRPECFLVATSSHLEGVHRFDRWHVIKDGQRFAKEEYAKFQKIYDDEKRKIVVFRVDAILNRSGLVLERSSDTRFSGKFLAYGSRLSTPVPVKSVRLQALGRVTVRNVEQSSATTYLRIPSELDLKMLGSPLVSQGGKILGVAVGNLWDTRLYLESDDIKEILDRDLVR